MSTMASQFTSLTNVYSGVYSGVDQIKHQSSTSLIFVRGIHRWPVNSAYKDTVTWKMFPFDDVVMIWGDLFYGILIIKPSPFELHSASEMKHHCTNSGHRCNQDRFIVVEINVLRSEQRGQHFVDNIFTLKAKFMGPIWGRQDPGGPHFGPMNFAIWAWTLSSFSFH